MLDVACSYLRSLRPGQVLKGLGWGAGAVTALAALALLGLESPLLMGLLHFVLLALSVILLAAGAGCLGLLLVRTPRGAVTGALGGLLVAPIILAFGFPNRAQLARICYDFVGYSATRIILDFEDSSPSLASVQGDLGALIQSTALPIRYCVTSRYGGHWEKDARPGYLRLEGRRLEVVTGQPLDPAHLKLLRAVLHEAFGPAPSLPSPLVAAFEVEGQAGTAALDPRGARLSVVERPRAASGGKDAAEEVDSAREQAEAFARRQLGLPVPRTFDLVLEVPIIGGSGSLVRLGVPEAKRRLPLRFPEAAGLEEVLALGVAAQRGSPLMMQIFLSHHEATDPEILAREQGFALAPAAWRADLARAVFPQLTARRARFTIEPGVRFSPRYTSGFQPVPPE